MSATSRIYTVHNLPAGKISIMPRPRGGDWLADDMKQFFYAGVDVLASLLTPDELSELDLAQEEVCCSAQGIIYLSYPILDRSVPAFSAETFKLLEQLKAYLDARKHVAVHCRMGLGRSALIAASALILSGFSPEQACRMLSDARGYSVPETREQRAWLEELSEQYRVYLQTL
jgi:protein-tyrosine phosphatase